MDNRLVLKTKRRSNTTIPCLKTPRVMRASTRIAGYRDPNSFRFCNDTGYDGHPAMTPATGSFQAWTATKSYSKRHRALRH